MLSITSFFPFAVYLIQTHLEHRFFFLQEKRYSNKRERKKTNTNALTLLFLGRNKFSFTSHQLPATRHLSHYAISSTCSSSYLLSTIYRHIFFLLLFPSLSLLFCCSSVVSFFFSLSSPLLSSVPFCSFLCLSCCPLLFSTRPLSSLLSSLCPLLDNSPFSFHFISFSYSSSASSSVCHFLSLPLSLCSFLYLSFVFSSFSSSFTSATPLRSFHCVDLTLNTSL